MERIMLLKALSGGAGRLGLWLAMVAAAAMAIQVSAEVLSRAFFNAPLPGTIEIGSYFYMVAITFLPVGYVQSTHSHISADAIAKILPRAIRPVTDFIGQLLSIAVTALLVYATIQMALRQTEIGETVTAAFHDIPIWPARWMLPIGLTAMLLSEVLQLFEPRRPDDDAVETPHD